MKFLGEFYVSCRSMSSELPVMVIRFKSGTAWPGSSAAPRHGAALYREHCVYLKILEEYCERGK